MSTRASNARHVRQRKLNTKQPLRVIRENELEEANDESQQHIPQVDTGVEKAEEIEYHLQAVINAASSVTAGTKTKQNYIPTPDAVRAKGVNYDELYPKGFQDPATYIRFSTTVEDSVGTAYCMDEDDNDFLTQQLNEGKDVHGQALQDKSHQCSEDAFEEVMSFLEDYSQRLRPFANLDNAPVPSLDELELAREEPLSQEAQHFVKTIYQYWERRKSGHSSPLMPNVKVRVLDTTSEADDADPYVCFRRREVRQTRKTRGRDAQVVEKLKKLRLELDQARQLVQMVREREELNKQGLEITRKVFEERRKLKEVKISKNIVGEKGEDEELLINQRPQPKTKSRQDGGRSGATIRLAPRTQSAPENDLISLSDLHAQAEEHVQQTIVNRKEQHRRWNQSWQDRTWQPLTPPPDSADQPPKWSSLNATGPTGYPTPPPSLPSRSSQDRDGDVEMEEQKPKLDVNGRIATEPQYRVSFQPVSLIHEYTNDLEPEAKRQRMDAPMCRLRRGRGGRLHLELRKHRPKGMICTGVVSDADSDDEVEDYHPVPESKTFDYRVALINARADRGYRPSGDQSAMVAQAQAAMAAGQAAQAQQATTAGS
ncbi:putative enhancer of polycomb protein [Septoria linicola]|nr:putative enhancer of polycomb protein [Septoria linicola]